ncbi:FixJ family two-component response regulator [Rhizobium mongolense]
MREALSELILSAGFQPVSFASTREVLNAVDILDSPGCLILDMHMPGASGLHLQHHLAESGIAKPIIFLTGHGDIPMTVQAMKAGAVDFLTKPVSDQTLLDAVIAGIALDGAWRAEAIVVKRNLERLGTLTPREREVLREVVTRGRLNKQIAFEAAPGQCHAQDGGPFHRRSDQGMGDLTPGDARDRRWILTNPTSGAQMAARAFASRAMKSQTSFTRNGTVRPKACSALKGALGNANFAASETSVPPSRSFATRHRRR